MSSAFPTKSNRDVTDSVHLESCHDDTFKSEKPISNAFVPPTTDGPHHRSTAEKRLVMKSDMIIIPLAAMIYFAAYLDRNSIGNARIMGLQTDLNINNQEYYNCAAMFYVGYIIFMLPGNVCLRYFLPHMQLGGCVILFGLLVTCMAAAQNYATMLALRISVGATQAFIQGLGLYVSLWYKRDELATRGALYYSAATIAGAFGGLISFGIQTVLTLKNTGRFPWQWLFIIEGVIGMGVGITCWVLLPRFPDEMKNGKSWLFTEEEIKLAMTRSSCAKVELKQIWVAFKDPKSWAFACINSAVALGISSAGVFLPTFIAAFGFTAERAQLFSVIPYACAFLFTPFICIISDRSNMKGPFLFFTLVLCVIGYILLLIVSSTVAKMVAACFIISGLYPSVILLVSWLGINTGGFTKRGTTWAMAEVFGQCFSIMGSNVYNDGPRYIQGHSIVLGFFCMAMASTIGLCFWMRHLNRTKEAKLALCSAQGIPHPHINRSLEEEYDFHLAFKYII